MPMLVIWMSMYYILSNICSVYFCREISVYKICSVNIFTRFKYLVPYERVKQFETFSCKNRYLVPLLLLSHILIEIICVKPSFLKKGHQAVV